MNLDDPKMQAVIDRLVRAKWIEGVVDGQTDFSHVQLTELGRTQMDQLAELMRPFLGCLLQGAKRPNLIRRIKVTFRFRHIISSLQPPEFAKGEGEAFVQLAALYESAGGDISMVLRVLGGGDP